MSFAEHNNFLDASPNPELADLRGRSHSFAKAAVQGVYRHFGKRLLDIGIVLASLPLLLPVTLVLAVMVARDGRNPFYGHLRIGRSGKPFRCWKLRSMVPDSAARLKEHLEKFPLAKLEWEANFKLQDDPRITPLGHILRRSSLDELPQLWNILTGDMSIVGPRPVTKDELALYGSDLPLYLSVRPGLTGLWQVSGRNDICYAERVALDARYVRRFGLLMDIGVIFATAQAVLKRTGK